MSTRTLILEKEFDCNNDLGPVGGKHQLGTTIVKNHKHVMRALYDFSVVGGAVSTINLKDEDGKDAVVPNKAIITSVFIDTLTAPTSGGAATIALGANSTTDLKAATAIASYTGIIAGVPVGTAATAVKLTNDRTITATVATAALTAGKIYVLIEYILSET